jgi:hypothetical protein
MLLCVCAQSAVEQAMSFQQKPENLIRLYCYRNDKKNLAKLFFFLRFFLVAFAQSIGFPTGKSVSDRKVYSF